jgi:hypothetical protein
MRRPSHGILLLGICWLLAGRSDYEMVRGRLQRSLCSGSEGSDGRA